MAIKDSDRRAIERFIARKQYDRAIEILERLHKKAPGELTIKQRLADAYYLYGQVEKAIVLLEEVAEYYARAGFVTKAMAVQKKVQRINPVAKLDIYKFVKEGDSGQLPVPPKTAVRAGQKEAEKTAAYQILDKLLAGLSETEFEDVYKHLEERVYKSNELIVKEGTESDRMFIICSGSVRVWMLYKNKEVELAILREGNFFGEVALLTGQKRTASITAMEECHLLQLTRENFDKLSKQYPHFRMTVEEAMEKRAYSTLELLKSKESE